MSDKIYEKPEIEPMNDDGQPQPMGLLLVLAAGVAVVVVSVAAVVQGLGVVEVFLAGGTAVHAVNVSNTINYYNS